jgi:hypothetical protein
MGPNSRVLLSSRLMGLLAEGPVPPRQKHQRGGNRWGWPAALSQDHQCGQASALQQEIRRRSRSA